MAEVGRYFDYDDQRKPMMVLYAKASQDGRRFAIRQQDAWKFSEEHNPLFISTMADAVQQVFAHLGFRVHVGGLAYRRRMAELAEVIQAGIDDLINMPPKPKDAKDDKVVAEGIMTIGSEKRDVTITRGLIND